MHPNRVLKANFWKSLIAVVAGNVLYLLVFSLLPEPARHRPFKLDLGLGGGPVVLPDHLWSYRAFAALASQAFAQFVMYTAWQLS